MAGDNSEDGDKPWLQQVLERMEDHILQVRRFMAESEKRWARNENRWDLGQKRWDDQQKRWDKNDARQQAMLRVLLRHDKQIKNLKPRKRQRRR